MLYVDRSVLLTALNLPDRPLSSALSSSDHLSARAIFVAGAFWPDCCGLCPPVIKQIVFWILFVGLGCLFLFQKLHERKQHLAKASLATAAPHSSPTPSASPVSPAAGQPPKPKPTAIFRRRQF